MVALAVPSSIPEHLRDEWQKLCVMSDDELSAAQAEAFALTENNLIRLAIIIRIREERGHDLSNIKIGLMRHLRRIADGKLLPEVVVRHAETPRVIARMANLPIDEQRRHVNAGTVPTPANKHRVRRIEPTPSRSQVEVDETRGAIIVTGIRVVLTAAELMLYLEQLGGAPRDYLCAGCGETYGCERPERCSKCGSHSFERVAARKVA